MSQQALCLLHWVGVSQTAFYGRCEMDYMIATQILQNLAEMLIGAGV